jgi:hypothetical protein
VKNQKEPAPEKKVEAKPEVKTPEVKKPEPKEPEKKPKVNYFLSLRLQIQCIQYFENLKVFLLSFCGNFKSKI